MGERHQGRRAEKIQRGGRSKHRHNLQETKNSDNEEEVAEGGGAAGSGARRVKEEREKGRCSFSQNKRCSEKE